MKEIKSTILISLFILTHVSIFAQPKYNFRTLANDFESIVKQPQNWDKNDILTIGGIGLLTYGTMYIDKSVREFAINNNEYNNTIPVEFGRIWGEPLATLGIASTFYLHGELADNDANKKLGFEIGEAALFTSIVTMVFKYGFGRERPRKNSDPFSFHPFSFRDDFFLSLNSGHTALAFSLSTVLAEHTENDYVKVLAFVPAFMTAFSRVYQNHHWTSDVILGGIIGYSVAEFVTRLHKSKKKSPNALDELNRPIPLFNFTIPF